MNASSASLGSGARDSQEVLGDAVPPQDYAAAAREHHEDLSRHPEKLADRSKSVPEEQIAFWSDSIKKFVSTFKQEGFWAALAGLGTVLFEKAWGSLGGAARETFGGISDLVDWIRSGFETVRSGTVLDLLNFSFRDILDGSTIRQLVTSIGDRIGLDELIGFKGKPLELGAFLLAKARDGVIEIPKALWEKLEIPLQFPSWQELGEELKETARLALNAVELFDEKSGLKELRGKLVGYFDANHPGWKESPTMAWVEKLNDPEQLAEDLKVDLQKPETWEKALGFAAGGTVLAGSYLLLRRLMGSDSPWPGRIMMNVGLFAFLKSKGVHDQFIGWVDSLQEIETKVCNRIELKIEGLLERYGVTPKDIGLEFEKGNSFGVTDGMKYILELSHEHPALALAAINGAWFMRHVFTAVIGHLLGFAKKLATGAKDVASWTLHHKTEAVALIAFLGVSVAQRRKIVMGFADYFYEEDLVGRAAFLESAEQYLGVKFDDPLSYVEKVTDPIFERLIRDPVECMTNAEFKIQLFNYMNEGKILWKTDSALTGIGLGIFVNFNPVWHAINVEAGIVESFLMEFANIGNPDQDFSVGAAVTLGAEGYIFGKFAKGAYKGYASLFNDIYGADQMRFFLKSLLPLTRENRSVWFSAFRETLDGLTLNQWTALEQSGYIKRMAYHADHALVAAEQGDLTRVHKSVRLLREYHDSFTEAKKGIVYYKDIGLQDQLYALRKYAEDLECVLRNPDSDRVKVARATEQAVWRLRDELMKAETRFSRLRKVGEYIGNGEIKMAFKEVAGINMPVGAIRVDELFAGKTDVQIRVRAVDLRREIVGLEEGSFQRFAKEKELRAIEAYLDPKRSDLLSRNFRAFATMNNPEKVAQLERMAAEMESVEKGVAARVTGRLDEIIAEAKTAGLALDSEVIQARIRQVDEDWVRPFWQQKKAYLGAISEGYKGLPKTTETILLRTQLELAQENTFLTRLVKGAKGRAVVAVVMLPLMFGLDMLLSRDDVERDWYDVLNDMGPGAGQLLLDILPVVGTYSNFHTAATGEEIVTHRTVKGWERASNWLWGSVGLVADTATVLTFLPSGSSSVGANASARLALLAGRGSRPAQKLLRMWPRITTIADDMGGFMNLGRSTRRWFQNMDRVRSITSLRRVATVGITAATLFTIGGVSADLIYGVEDGDEGIDYPQDFTPGAALDSAMSGVQDPLAASASNPPPDAGIEHLTEAA